MRIRGEGVGKKEKQGIKEEKQKTQRRQGELFRTCEEDRVVCDSVDVPFS